MFPSGGETTARACGTARIRTLQKAAAMLLELAGPDAKFTHAPVGKDGPARLSEVMDAMRVAFDPPFHPEAPEPGQPAPPSPSSPAALVSLLHFYGVPRLLGVVDVAGWPDAVQRALDFPGDREPARAILDEVAKASGVKPSELFGAARKAKGRKLAKARAKKRGTHA